MEPLAERIRPKDLEHYLGQSHIIGKGSALRGAIEQNLLPSLIFLGTTRSWKNLFGTHYCQ